TPLRERARAAEHDQAAAALLDEVRDHAELIAGERARLDAAEDQAAIREQLFARLREAAEQVLGIVHVDPEVLVVGGALERDDLEVQIVGDGAADELHLEPRLALEV